MGKNSIQRLISEIFIIAFIALTPSLVFAEGESAAAAAAENRPGVPTAEEAAKIISKIDQAQLDPNKALHKKAVESCKSEVSKTDQQCSASQNANSQNAQQQMNNNQQANQGDAAANQGQAGRCGDFGSMAQAALPMMQGYKSECDTARAACKSTCSQEQKTSKQSCAKIVVSPTDPTSQQKKTECEQNAQAAEDYAKKVNSACNSYKQNSDQAAKLIQGLLGAVASMMACQQDQGVEEESQAELERQCTLTKDPAVCTRADSAGAAEMAKKMMQDAAANNAAAPEGAVDGRRSKDQAAGGGSPPYAPAGGVGGGGGKAGASKDEAAGGPAAKKEVYEGDYGGGGRGMASMGGGYPDAPESMATALKNAQLRRDSIANQFTGGGGRSNWQKVRERYRDNSPSLDANSVSK